MTPPTSGYHGAALVIDAANGATRRLPIDAATQRRYLGGSGLGCWLLLKLGAPAIEPLAAAAPLAFVFSPLVGSPLTTSAKFAVCCRSPLTERWNDSLASSGFALAGKRTGADALAIVGRAPRWSVLVIDDGCARLDDAGDLVGLPIPAAEAALRARYGPDYAAAVIGPAGERQVRFATISHDGRHAGRGGSGAVLGAKQLKAVLVRGGRRTPLADPAGLSALAKDLSQRSLGPATAKYRELGTVANLVVFNRLHALPTRNFQAGSFAAAEAFSPEVLAAERTKVRAHCAACTIGCEHIYGVRRGDATSTGVRLEYENLFALGPLCGVAEPDAVLAASQRCDQWGLDTISTGGVIAFAMEGVERGLLTEPWLRFGDGDALLRAIDLIGRREGLGDRLAEGSRRLALQLGGDALDFAPQVKGLEMPGYEPRSLQTMALGLAVGARGADHNRSGAYEVDFSPAHDRRAPDAASVAAAIDTENKAALIDSLIFCKFLRGVFDDLYTAAAEMLHLVCGWDVTAAELRATAARIVAARRLFNQRAGWTAAEDTLPKRFLERPLDDDPRAVLTAERLHALVAEYERQRAWPVGGWSDDTLVSLDLGDVADDSL